MNKTIILLSALLFVLVGCTKENTKSKTSTIEVTKNNDNEIRIGDYFGLVYKTKITADKVNIRKLPSIDSEIVKQLNTNEDVIISGVSIQSEALDKAQYYWYRIRLLKDINSVTNDLGWVYGQFIETNNIKPEEITVVSFTPENNDSTALLNIKTNDTVVKIALYKTIQPGQYTFAWTDDQKEYKYNQIPGTYIYNYKTKQLEHGTYLGYELESGNKFFDSDKKYFFQDFGTSSGIRSIGVYDIKTSSEVFNGQYYKDLDLKGSEITIVVDYSKHALEDNLVDDESKKHAEEYIKSKDGNTSSELAVQYRYNLGSKERQFLQVIEMVVQ